MMRICGATVTVCLFFLAACSSSEPPSVASSTPTFACSAGTPADGRIVGVRGSGHKLYAAPNPEAAPIINQKATKIIGETQYQEIDSSTQVQVQCTSGTWSKVRLTQPEWLRHVHGWVESEYLLLPSQSGAARKYAASDIFWDKHTSPHKAAIVQAVNRLHSSNAKCKGNLDPGTVAQSSIKSRPGKPVFFVTCGNGKNVSNVYFTLK